MTSINPSSRFIDQTSAKKGYLLTGIQSINSFFKNAFNIRDCNVDFIEISLKDEKALEIKKFLLKKETRDIITSLTDAGVSFTLHGEGEIDDRRRIYFAHPDDYRRKQYIRQTINYLSTVINLLDDNVLNIVIHPDLLLKKVGRSRQIELLAESLTTISDSLSSHIPISIESRGSKKPRCLRPEINDLSLLDEKLAEFGTHNVFHCIDVAQAMIYHDFSYFPVQELVKTFHDRTKEYHLSDVTISSRNHPMLGRPLGKGIIEWKTIVPRLSVNALHLFETLGGIKAFEYSCETFKRVQQDFW